MKNMILLTFCMALATMTHAGEVMMDKCGQMVAIVPSYDAIPNTPGTVILRRSTTGVSAWTRPFTVKLGPDGHIRWWCQPAEGQLFVPDGIWRIPEKPHIGLSGSTNVTLIDFTDYGIFHSRSSSDILTGLTFASSVWKGWTKEKSRCDDRSTRIRARLRPWRELQIECLGN
ncbi:MAG TPA: hypothetical protein VFQ78_01840 [Candidatus Udaeobacter sp.]|jgi:hypothetical protein|nr:hypothetical protein [Candidatus Udaeobacter sp.]